MKFKDNEHVVKTGYGIETITILRSALESWKNHYLKVSDERSKNASPEELWQAYFYMGKADVLCEILKHFEEE